MEDEFLTLSELCIRLKVSRPTVMNMINTGKLTAIILSGDKRKSYRVLVSELDRFIASEYQKKIKDD